MAGSNEVCVSTIENTAWDRELSAFICVAATVLDLLPSDMRSLMSFLDKAVHNKKSGFLLTARSQTIKRTENDLTASFERFST